jgi:ABC-2 type transport system ATP-binding protein
MPTDIQIESEGITTKLSFDTRKHTATEMLELISRRFDVQDITIEEPGIDHVVSRIFSESAEL